MQLTGHKKFILSGLDKRKSPAEIASGRGFITNGREENHFLYPMFLLYLLDDSLESICIVDCEVSKNLAVNLDAILVESTHELAVAHIVEAGCCVDTLNPKSAEVALLVTAVTVRIRL